MCIHKLAPFCKCSLILLDARYSMFLKATLRTKLKKGCRLKLYLTFKLIQIPLCTSLDYPTKSRTSTALLTFSKSHPSKAVGWVVKRGCKFRWVLPLFTCCLLRSWIARGNFSLWCHHLTFRKEKSGRGTMSFLGGRMGLEKCVGVKNIWPGIWKGESQQSGCWVMLGISMEEM